MNNKDKKHLNWIYDRMVVIHRENPLVDYMRQFREIIDRGQKSWEEDSFFEFEVPDEEHTKLINTESVSLNTQLVCPKCGAKNFIRGGDCMVCDRGLQI